MAAPGDRFHFRRGFFPQCDRDHFMALPARFFQRQNRKSAIAGDESVSHKEAFSGQRSALSVVRPAF
jgi:hypothetical protein